MGSNADFGRDFERALVGQVQDAVRDAAKEYQRMFDDIGRKYRGRPVAEIKPVLRRGFSRHDGTVTDSELTDYARLISEGTQIKIKIR